MFLFPVGLTLTCIDWMGRVRYVATVWMVYLDPPLTFILYIYMCVSIGILSFRACSGDSVYLGSTEEAFSQSFSPEKEIVQTIVGNIFVCGSDAMFGRPFHNQ